MFPKEWGTLNVVNITHFICQTLNFFNADWIIIFYKNNAHCTDVLLFDLFNVSWKLSLVYIPLYNAVCWAIKIYLVIPLELHHRAGQSIWKEVGEKLIKHLYQVHFDLTRINNSFLCFLSFKINLFDTCCAKNNASMNVMKKKVLKLIAMTSSGTHTDTKLSAHSKVRLGITYYLFSASKPYHALWKVKHLAEFEYRICLKNS